MTSKSFIVPGKSSQSFQAGIYADTPAEVVALIVEFRMGNLNEKGEAARRLKEKGKTDLLRRLIAKETSRDHARTTEPVVGGRPVRRLPRFMSLDRCAPTSAARPMRQELALEARLRLAQGNVEAAERLLAQRDRRRFGAGLRRFALEPEQTR